MLNVKTFGAKELYHAFFYAGIDGKTPLEGKTRASIWYRDEAFYHYSTTIGWLFNRKGKKPIFFYCSLHLSNTTSRHVSYLAGACPYESYAVPFHMYDKFSNDKDFAEEMTRRLGRYMNEYKKEDFTALEERDGFSKLYNVYKVVSKLTDYKLNPDVKKHVDELHKFIVASEKDDNLIKELRAEKRKKAAEEKKRAKEQMERMRQRVEALVKDKGGLLEYLKGYDQLSLPERETLQAAYGTDAFVWPTGDNVKTSKWIVEPLSSVKLWLRRWKKGDLKVGMHLGPYTVNEVSDAFFKLGCHRFCNVNVEQLYDAVFGKEAVTAGV